MSLITQAMIIQKDIQLDQMLMHGGKNHLSHIFNYFRLDASNPTMIEEKVILVAFVLFVVEGVIVQSKLHFNSILSNIQYPYYVFVVPYIFISLFNCLIIIAKNHFISLLVINLHKYNIKQDQHFTIHTLRHLGIEDHFNRHNEFSAVRLN